MTRDPLPNCRHCERFTVEHDGFAYTITVGEYPDGRIGEIFVDGGKAGTPVQALARDCAVLASLALQHGCSAETIQKALTRIDDATPAGPMGKAMDEIVEVYGSVSGGV
jgi:hypothetical protein